MSDELLPVLRVRPSDVAARVLVVGDPKRAAMAAQMLGDAQKVGENREYTTYTGTMNGVPITIASHGVGSAGAGVCFEELARAGAQTIIRAGTCGALQDGMKDGSLVIATGAIRDEGLTPRLVPLSYPALAHHEVIAGLAQGARAMGVEHHLGVVLTSDLFYPAAVLGPPEWRLWQASHAVAVEMELAALLIVAALHGIRAGGVLTIDGNPTRSADMRDYDPHRTVVSEGVLQMLRVALETMRILP